MLTRALSQGPLIRALGALGQFPLIPRIITNLLVYGLANATGPRPRPFSLATDYTSWVSLTDRTFSGRHLPASEPTVEPSQAEVKELFRRPPGGEKASTDTSVMFMLFAQWFTDSFLRTERSDWRKNTSTQEIDFCQIYGLTEAKTRLLREMAGGRLKSQQIDNEEYPPFLFQRTPGGEYIIKPEFQELHDEAFLTQILKGVPDQQKDLFFAVGLEHGNSTVGSTALDVLFLREHNRITALLSEEYHKGKLDGHWPPEMSEEELDERLFQTTRNIMIVLLLKLVIEEYIRHITPFDLPITLVPGSAQGKRWNAPNRVAIEFNLLYRWHSLVPDYVMTDDGKLDAKEFLRDNNRLVLSKGIGWLMDQCSRSRASKVGLFNTPAFLIDKNPDLGYPGIEERTIDLMRKARLQSYNAYRRQFNLAPVMSFDDLTSDATVKERLSALYGDIDKLEWYVGIFAEDYPDNMLFGDLMTTMVGHDAFTQVLTNPLLAADVYTEATFTRAGLTIIEQTENLRQIAARNAQLSTDAAVSFKYVPRRPGAGVAAAGDRRSVGADHLPADAVGSGLLTDAR